MGDGERLLISVSLFHEDAGVGMVVDFLGAGDVKRSLFPVHLIILMKQMSTYSNKIQNANQVFLSMLLFNGLTYLYLTSYYSYNNMNPSPKQFHRPPRLPHHHHHLSAHNPQPPNTGFKLYSSEKSIPISPSQHPNHHQPTSFQIMQNLNSSLDGLFSRIKQIKDQHAPIETKTDQNLNRKDPLKPPKLISKPFSMQNFPELHTPTLPTKSQRVLPLNSDRLLYNGGLLSSSNLKSSMEIKEDDFLNEEVQSPGLNIKREISLCVEEKMKINDFELGKCVGSGKFGDVFVCRHKSSQTLYALKKIFKSTIKEYDMIEQFTNQLRIHYSLNHPNIIKLYTHFDDEYHIFLLMEYAQGGILMDKLKSTEEYAANIIQQVIHGVEYLHSKRIAHRDIKPENIVLQFGNIAKLCDFGWSSFYHNSMKTTFCGTLDYLSPQMKDRGQYDSSVDLWSIGILTFQLLIGEPPYKKELSQWRNKGGKRGDKSNWNIIYPGSISTVAQSFMRNLLKQKPEQRCTLKFCLNHYFIRKHRKEQEGEGMKRLGNIL